MKDPLLARLEAFEPGLSAPAFPFEQRLARENNWDPDFTGRVILEYKRFVFLAVRAGHPVTPSHEVDQAWHLHLCHTRSYWDDLCGGILGQPLHHAPTKGGAAETEKFHDWYAKTLESYRRLIGVEPPEDIWPAPGARFRASPKWIETSRYWVLRKPRATAAARVAALAGALLVTAGCGGWMMGEGDAEVDVVSVLVLFAVFLGILGLLVGIWRWGSGGKGGGGCGAGGGCGSGGNSCGSGCGGD